MSRMIAAGRGKQGKVSHLGHEEVHDLALSTLEENLSLHSSGPQSSGEKVLDVLLAAAAKCSSIEQECRAHRDAPSPNTSRGSWPDM